MESVKLIFRATYIGEENYNEEMIIGKFLEDYTEYANVKYKIKAVSKKNAIKKNWEVIVYEKD